MPFIVDKEFGRELSRNYGLMKTCKKINSIAFFTYIILGILMMAYSFISIVGVSWDWLSVELEQTPFAYIAFAMILDTFIVCPLSAFLTYRASIHHHDLAAMIVLAIQAVNMVLMIVLECKGIISRIPVAFIGMMIYTVACLVTGGANMWAIIKYHWLEQQRGFPHFSARFEEQKEDKFQRGIMDQFEQEVSRLKKTSSDAMNDIGQSDEKLDKYQHEHKPSTMDEI
ncbi:MAG: hypothetical protein J6P14_02545 [Ruminococcus sp.]|nr:hypothetical protein [Ruminococcus sp.]